METWGAPWRVLTLGGILVVLGTLWLAAPVPADEAGIGPTVRTVATPTPRALPPAPAEVGPSLSDVLNGRDLRGERATVRLARVATRARLHANLRLHGVGSQLYTAWNTPVTLKAVNWYGFEYAPFVPGGLDRQPLDTILATVRRLGFNALRLTFADATVRRNPVVSRGLDANPQLRGLRSLDIMQRVIRRAGVYGLRVILCNSRSEAGRGPERQTGLWYTKRYPASTWVRDWVTLVRRFRGETAFVGADLRNEPHVTGTSFDANATLTRGPLWGPISGVAYAQRDWRAAAQSLGNTLLAIDPRLLIVIEGVQMYLDSYRGVLTGGLWGSNLVGVQYAPIVLSRPSQLVYSVHEYGPSMWQGEWFNPNTTYLSLFARWYALWGYLLSARPTLRAPIFVGEFGTCHTYWSCISSRQGWKQGFWFQSFVRYLREHPQVGWAYWALNPDGPFRKDQIDYYSVVSLNWKHYYPLLTYGLQSILREPSGIWTAPPRTRTLSPQPGCPPAGSCVGPRTALELSTDTTRPAAPPAPTSLRIRTGVPYVSPADADHRGDLYLPRGSDATARPAVVVVHGGDFLAGRRGLPGTVRLSRALAAHGYVVFDVDYRLLVQGGGVPGSVIDVKDAVAYLAAHARRWGIDPRRIAVAGAGSGGYLAELAGYTRNRGPFAPTMSTPRPVAVAALFAPPELRAADAGTPRALPTYLGRGVGAMPGAYRAASPATYAGTGVATVLIAGRDDVIVPFARQYAIYQALRQGRRAAKLIDLPGAPRAITDLTPAQFDAAVLQVTRFFDGIFYRPVTAPRLTSTRTPGSNT